MQYAGVNIIASAHLREFAYCFRTSGALDIHLNSFNVGHYLIFAVMERGELSIDFNGQRLSYRGPRFVNFNLFTRKVDRAVTSPAFCGYIVAFHREALMNIIWGREPLPGRPPTENKPTMDLALSRSELKDLTWTISCMIRSLRRGSNLRRHEICASHVNIFVNEVTNIVMRHSDAPSTQRRTGAYPEKLVGRLMQELASHIDHESDVEFYAGQLNVSRQYLAESVKKVVGVTIGHLISGLRYGRCVYLLQDMSLSVKEVSERMSFPDQSAFGKFFRRHSGGISPTAYRRSGSRHAAETSEES